MSNTIEDLIRDIIYYEFEEKEDQLVQVVREGINLELPDYDSVEIALKKLERRIKVLEEKIK